MKVLQLFSNHKFTGPADPALILAQGLADRGISITFIPGKPHQAGSVFFLAQARGIATADLLQLKRHGEPFAVLSDASKLRRYLREQKVDLIHTHLGNDHLIATLAASSSGVPVVRTCYDSHPPSGLRARFALQRTHGVLVFSSAVAEQLHTNQPTLKVEVIDPAVDLQRFNGATNNELRKKWGVPEDGMVVGVVARMQTHRRFPELIQGFARAARDDAGLHLVILGRGTQQEKVAKEPARRSVVPDQIHFPGYISAESYPAALSSFDALIFLVPGSDGTCRAAREALACGVPVISSRRGMLPEYTCHRENGLLLADESPKAIASAIRELRDDGELRHTLSETAREGARQCFAPERQARRVHDFYRQILDSPAS
ncbi:MAG: glycosyltransferase family 4 protein [Planctomycetota bacterium]